MKKLFLKPTGGLGNRMNAIASAVQMAKDQQRSLTIFWERKWELNAHYEDIFVNSNLNIIEKDLYNFPQRLFAKLDKRMDSLTKNALKYTEEDMYRIVSERNTYDFIPVFKEKANVEEIFIETCFNFYEQRNFHLSELFIPTQEIKSRLEEAKKSLGSNYVAMHIRRTDHGTSIENSPDEVFYHAMEQLNPDQKVFLCTDDKPTEEKFKKRFANRIITVSQDKSRDTSSGIKSALTDLMLLSGASKIYGSFNSTFSSIASEYGNTELEIMQKS